MNVWFIVTTGIYLYIFVRRFLYSVYIYQLVHYQIGSLLDWYYINKTNKKLLIPLVISILSLILVLLISFKYLLYFEMLLGIISLPFIKYQPEKNKFNFTKRMKRLFACVFILMLLLYFITFGLLNYHYQLSEISFIYLLIINFLVFDLVIIAHFLAYPLEKLIQNKFINQAMSKILENNRLSVIGITGSFGKTSTKFIIGNILKRAANVCVTPESYNTPMGITLSVNRYLKNIDDYFVCEMGARRVGEIKELTEIVFPKIGVLTSIGPQHLETFGNIKNIIKTKFELIESLPNDGLAILNYDNLYIRDYQLKSGIKVLTYGIENKDVDYHGFNIYYGKDGSRFEIKFPNQEKYLFTTKLLGKHNISNILAGVALADYLAMNVNKIINTVSLLKPIEHRLELKAFENYSIIDDSFNANYEGACNALDILNHFHNIRIIITPGLIELGIDQDNYNYYLGEKIAKICDFVVLVGVKQTYKLYEALEDVNYPQVKILVTNSYNEGFKYILDTFKENFTLLIENDLPDNYSEI